jgi:hypothetical protein
VWGFGQCHWLVLSNSSKIDVRVIIDVEASDRVKVGESVTWSGRGEWRSTEDYVT